MRGVGSRICGAGSLLRSLRALRRRTETYALHRARTRPDTLWAGRFADALDVAWTIGTADEQAKASLALADRRAAVTSKTPRRDTEDRCARC